MGKKMMAVKRAPNFTSEEVNLIINYIKDHPDLVSGSLGGKYKSAYAVRKAWEELTSLVNSSGSSGYRRKIEDIKKKWKDLKHTSKKKAADYKMQMKNGVGPPPKKLSQVESAVIKVIGSKCIDGIGGLDTSLLKENCAPENETTVPSTPEDAQMIACSDGDISDLYAVTEVGPKVQNDMKTEDSQANANPISRVSAEEAAQSALNPEEAISQHLVLPEKENASNGQTQTFTKPTSHSVVPFRTKKFRMSTASEHSDRTINRIRYLRNDESRQKSHDEFEYFGQNIACQLRQLPLDMALQCQSDILNLVQKRRIECMRHESADVSKHAPENLLNSSISPDVKGYLQTIYDES